MDGGRGRPHPFLCLACRIALTQPQCSGRIFKSLANGTPAIINVQQIKNFHDTRHADNRRNERMVSLQSMKDVVNYHDRKLQQIRGEHGGFVYRFSKKAGTDTLVVIAEVKKHECWLISAWSM